MDAIRNFINVSGLADESELLEAFNGQIIQYSENDTIYIPVGEPEMQSLFHVMLKIDIGSDRKINTPLGTTVILDGVKKVKIIYSTNENSSKANFLNLELPYNTFFELPKGMLPNEKIKVFVIDAYFSMLDSKRIYSHIVYMIYVNVTQDSSNSERNSVNAVEKLSPYNNFIQIEDVDGIGNTCLKSGKEIGINGDADSQQHYGNFELLVDIDTEYL